MDFQDILRKYRAEAFSQRDKGDHFERLMANFLRTYPPYEGEFAKIWLWKDCPFHKSISPSGKDIGIDLVLRNVDGGYWAVQCKCLVEDAYVNKQAVDSFLGASGKRFRDEAGRESVFSNRLWIATTDNWSAEAERELDNQTPSVNRIGLANLDAADVDWDKLDRGLHGREARPPRKTLMEHQSIALEKAVEHFKEHDRGQLIMACGTGKTFTSLKIAEELTKGRGLVLFLVPSIALIGQTLREWTANANSHFHAVCVCSDAEVSKGSEKIMNDRDMSSVVDLALPATTDPLQILRQLEHGRLKSPQRLNVIFSTYHSIERVAQALKTGKHVVDLIVCDEAHRTTGVISPDDEESHFVKVHDPGFIIAKKRMYMTATPRIFADMAKKKAENCSMALCSMDDESLYGPEIYHLGFGEAVDRGLLSDYKLLVLTVNRLAVPEELQAVAAEGKKEIDTDAVTKLVGCLNALSKNMDYEHKILSEVDPGRMRKAVAFCQTIPNSMAITGRLNRLNGDLASKLTNDELERLVDVSAMHIDGRMGATERDRLMSWLKAESGNQNDCRVLTNVRCLSEGVDVPTLDAVLFISPKNSQIEVVQSVGRVMRRAPGKKFGYIIIPVIVPSYVEGEAALDENKEYEVLWTVLNALKAHDDRFKAIINKIEFNVDQTDGKGKFIIGGIAGSVEETKHLAIQKAKAQDLLAKVREKELLLHNAIYAKIVKRMGSKHDMMRWAMDVAKIADGFKKRIATVVGQDGPHKIEFENFLESLRQTLNPSINDAEAIEMLAQHLISKPVFEALFDDYSFVKNNPVSRSLEAMIDVLEDQGLEKDKIILSRFYKTVRDEVAGIDNPAAKQKIMVNLYENFFRLAMRKTVDRLGVVYTPIEVVDFINHSVAKVLRSEFGRDISDPEAHILDPFAGTGTFIARLIQTGLLGEGDRLAYKYANELHANEMVLLAYYIASVNIENAYHAAMGEPTDYHPFDGICLTDTFQLFENNTTDILKDQRLKQNIERVNTQTLIPITVIIGNPPYSVGQGDANKNAKNQFYPLLEQQINLTYGHESVSANVKSLYDSYIKAIRWASNRLELEGCGVVAFVSNAGWLDGNAMDGMRKCLAEDFSKIYIFNLRGNQRTSGELSRKEGGKIFGSGSRTPIAITILIKNPAHKGQAEIYHHDVGDYLSREDKLAILAKAHDLYNPGLAWEKIEPNEAGDWLNQRSDTFKKFYLIGKKNYFLTIFKDIYSYGITTNRDIWNYNYSKNNLLENINNLISFYNFQRKKYNKIKLNNDLTNINSIIEYDNCKISWSRSLIKNIERNIQLKFDSKNAAISLYRPFLKQHLYFDKKLIEYIYTIPQLFPTQNHHNLVICVSGIGVNKEFSTIMTNILPDLELIGKSQCFPRYHYEDLKTEGGTQKRTLFDSGTIIDGHKRHDAITDYILEESRARYGSKVNKDAIFYYVYGFLHSEDYRAAFSADLKKSLPRLPLVDKPEDFWAFSKAGRDLAELHLNYETVKPYGQAKVTGEDRGDFIVEKMRFAGKDDRTAILYNQSITVSGIPPEAYDYVVNGRSAIEWVMDRYQVKVDKDSGIKNDPNDWAREHGQPRYILDLLLGLITVSLETMKIVKGLPKLEF
ncbi:MAG: DEAD/DEAH box helicase family protein [Deltaproteobacteria bacterium]|jgi:predicted helicase|nr:DEAD/DEAH box helicase family protein [Deltaproteobacteria bacterium]